LSRYEWPSLWETKEVQDTLSKMWQDQLESYDDYVGDCFGQDDSYVEEGAAAQGSFNASLDPEYCHDRFEPRCTMKQYVALVGQDVAANLEGIASARLEKRPRQYQSDAAVHQAYMQATTGGGTEGEDGDGEGSEIIAAPKPASLAHFEPLPWNISTAEDMQNILDFKHRLRLTQFAKELLKYPCMQSIPVANTGDAPEFGASWREHYSLAALPQTDLIELANLQSGRMDISHDEAEIDVGSDAGDDDKVGSGVSAPPECFSNQFVYAKPSDYVLGLVAKLPPEKKLTRDQTNFMIRFAVACDEAWEDELKPPCDSNTNHIVLLGQGGSGKTHVVQNLVFEAVHYIGPPRSNEEPTLMVTASSHEQAKNISTAEVKARTLHNASGMRVQKLITCKMRPGEKQKNLSRL